MNPVNEHEKAGLPENASGGGELDSYQFSALSDKARPDQSANLGFILDIPLEVSVELGRTQMLVNDLLKLGQGSVIELSKLAGETLEILATTFDLRIPLTFDIDDMNLIGEIIDEEVTLILN